MTARKVMTFVFVAVVLGQLTTGQVLSSSCCPSNIEVVDNFDVSQYLGLWYEYAKYPQYFEGDGVCVTAQYSLQTDGNVAVQNSQTNAR